MGSIYARDGDMRVKVKEYGSVQAVNFSLFLFDKSKLNNIKEAYRSKGEEKREYDI